MLSPTRRRKHPAQCLQQPTTRVQTRPNTRDSEPLVSVDAVLLYFWLHLQLKDLEKTPPNTHPNLSSPFLTQLQT